MLDHKIEDYEAQVLLVRAITALRALQDSPLHKALTAAAKLNLEQLRYPPEAPFPVCENIKGDYEETTFSAKQAVEAIGFGAEGRECVAFFQQLEDLVEAVDLSGEGAGGGVRGHMGRMENAVGVLEAGMEAAACLIVPVQVTLGGRVVTLGVNDVKSGGLGGELVLQLIQQKYMARTRGMQGAEVWRMRSAEASADQKGLMKRDECCWNCGKTAKDMAKASGGGGGGSSSASGEKLLKCSRCKRALYCSAECQKVHWKASHKAMCRPEE